MIPETKGRSLEEMDIIFGSVKADQREADIARQEQSTSFRFVDSRPALTALTHSLRTRSQ